MFRTAVLALLATMAAARSIGANDGIPADSKAANRLLKNAQVVEPSRHLANNNERDVTFISQYSIKYLGCSSLPQVRAEGGGQDQGFLYNENLVKFALCPSSSSCGSCSGGGVYLTTMNEFIDAWTEAQLTDQEYRCESIRENCYCNNNNNNGNYNEEYCENQCYIQNNAEYCIQYEGGEEFQIQEYLECKEMQNNNGNGNNQNYGNYQNGNGQYYGQLFVGAYCANDGRSINLGVFYDEMCSSKASDSLYSQANYGQTLPFSKESIVKSGSCMSCEQQDNNNNGNNYQNQNNQYGQYYAEPNELCTNTYQTAARCESKMDIMYPDTQGCHFINKVLPKLEAAARGSGLSIASSSTGGAAVAFAWLFAITTIVFGAYAYFLYRKIKRSQASLV